MKTVSWSTGLSWKQRNVCLFYYQAVHWMGTELLTCLGSAAYYRMAKRTFLIVSKAEKCPRLSLGQHCPGAEKHWALNSAVCSCGQSTVWVPLHWNDTQLCLAKNLSSLWFQLGLSVTVAVMLLARCFNQSVSGSTTVWIPQARICKTLLKPKFSFLPTTSYLLSFLYIRCIHMLTPLAATAPEWKNHWAEPSTELTQISVWPCSLQGMQKPSSPAAAN